ncbi:hypothetical protein NWF32_24935 [Pseudomonas qingdaonensis]|nr:hypothetical protein [Pseudomonas qingdaonensis]
MVRAANRYAYCSGDPVNRVDPDGHAWWNWVVAGIGLVMGAIAVVVTAGTAAPAVGAAYSFARCRCEYCRCCGRRCRGSGHHIHCRSRIGGSGSGGSHCPG